MDVACSWRFRLGKVREMPEESLKPLFLNADTEISTLCSMLEPDQELPCSDICLAVVAEVGLKMGADLQVNQEIQPVCTS